METESQFEQVENETTGVSDSQVEETTSGAQTLTQEEVNRIVAERVERERKKFERKYGDIDIDRYRQLTEAEEARKIEEQKARGQFEEVLKETVGKKDAELQRLQSELKNIKVDGAMLNAASTNKAINPQQVVSLLKNQVRLSDTGDVEVVDPESGMIRYNDNGEHMTTDELIREFLHTNPHFVAATPTGTGTRNSGKSEAAIGFDPLKADLNDPAQRALYAEWRRNNYTNVRKL
jgi:hypothetical protein